MLKTKFDLHLVQSRPAVRTRKDGHPWLDRQGHILSDEKLETVSKDWSYDTWQRFLNWLDVPLAEVLIRPSLYDYLSENLQTSVFEVFSDESEVSPSPNLSLLLRQLTKKQRQVIKLIFWEGLNEREAAASLEISRGAVRDLKDRGLNKLS